jgi:agmatine deiminase
VVVTPGAARKATAGLARGFVHPAEWEPHEATWLGWPVNARDWPGKLGPIPWVYAEIVRKLAEGETVRIIVPDTRTEKAATAVLRRAHTNLARVEFFRFPTDRGWTRDMGPIFAINRKARKAVVLNFRFNGWAKYTNWKKDTLTHARAAKALGLPLVTPEHRGRQVVLEGGAIDANGRGTILTTEECLLDQAQQVRNPGFTRADMEAVFRNWRGAPNTIWLGKGIAGDDTHGHVDDLCRFVNPTTVVLAMEHDRNDVNYAPLQENRERLRGARLEDGSKLKVVELPMPRPQMFDGVRLPASYANFYIGNAAVLVPTFNDPNDRLALGILADVFRDRPVVGIHAVDLVWGFGTLHCLSHEQPASR